MFGTASEDGRIGDERTMRKRTRMGTKNVEINAVQHLVRLLQ